MESKLSINLLLKANFSRLWRSTSFWVTVGVMLAISIFELAVSYQPRLMGAEGIMKSVTK